MSRMPKGYGSKARQVRPGTWVIQISAGKLPDGRRNRIAVVRGTKRECEDAAAKVLAQHRNGELPISEVRTVKQLVQKYTEAHTVADSTWTRYEGVYRLYLVPALGTRLIRSITPQELNRFFDACRQGPFNVDEDERQAREPVDDSTVNNVKIALGSLFKYAVTRGYATKNVVRESEKISVKSRPAFEMSDDQIVAFLRSCAKHPFGPYFETLFFQLVRESEGFGLRWKDLNRPAKTVSIRWQLRSEVGKGQVGKEPKWGSTRTEVPWMDGCFDAVARREAQRATWRKLREDAGKSWHETEYVFGLPDGRPLYAKAGWRAFYEICDEAEIPCRPEEGDHLTIGDLRHNGARFARRSGVKIEVIAKLLGHSRTTTTEHYLGLKNFVPTAADVAGANEVYTQLREKAPLAS